MAEEKVDYEKIARAGLFDQIRAGASSEELAKSQSALLSFANSKKSTELSSLERELKRRRDAAKAEAGSGPGKNPCYGSVGTANCDKNAE